MLIVRLSTESSILERTGGGRQWSEDWVHAPRNC